MSEVAKNLADIATVLIFVLALIGLGFIGFLGYRLGVSSRERLERSAGVYPSVEAHKEKLKAEVKDIDKRKAELERFL
jgi:hypothetical protein